MDAARLNSAQLTLHRSETVDRGRIGRLEQHCSLLWSREPAMSAERRESALRRLAELERDVASAALRSLAEPDHPELDRQIRHCEKELAELTAHWAERSAA